MSRRTLILVVIIFVQLVTLSLVASWQFETTKEKHFFENNEPPAVPKGREIRDQFLNYWQAGLTTVGAGLTYEKFRRAYTNESAFVQHNAAHLFGNLLFKELGEQGLYICDRTYSWGCYHAMISNILTDQGEGKISHLDRFCADSVGCLHGIGHGLVGYVGYDQAALLKAIDLCKLVKTPDPVDGCLGGVFMEYNQRTMLRSEDILPRALPEVIKADQECGSSVIDDTAKGACYFWLAQWFVGSGAGNLMEKFDRAATACSTANNQSDRLLCYSGLGYELVGYTNDPDTVEELCGSATSKLTDPYFYIQCLASAAAGFAIDASAGPKANLICDRLTKDNELSYCRYAASNFRDRRIEVFKVQ